MDCEEQLDFCADETVKCDNGGTCFTWQPDSNGELVPAICSCAAGFTGEHCETLIDNCASDPCIHHGRSVSTVISLPIDHSRESGIVNGTFPDHTTLLYDSSVVYLLSRIQVPTLCMLGGL